MPRRLNLGSKFLKEDLLTITPVNGEFYFATDTNELFFCDDDELKLINANVSGGAPAPIIIDLAELPRDGDIFDLDISGFSGKHVTITNSGVAPLEPTIPANKFMFRLRNELDLAPLYNPIEFNLSVDEINGAFGFNFSLTGANSFINYKEYTNAVESGTPAQEYVSTANGILNIRHLGDTAFIALLKNLAM